MRDRAGSLARLHELAALRDGWYNYGESKEITRLAISTAYALTSGDVQPYIYPTPEGGLSVEWDGTDRHAGFDVLVYPDGTIEISYSDHDCSKSDTESVLATVKELCQ